MEINDQPSTAQRFLAFILGKKKPAYKAKVYQTTFVTVHLEADAVLYLREQLAVNISQKTRGLANVPFVKNELEQLDALLPATRGLVMMSDLKRNLLGQYTHFFWVRAKESEDFLRESAYDALLDGLHFAKPQKPVFA